MWVLRIAANLWEDLGRPLGHFPWELDLPGGKYLVAPLSLLCVLYSSGRRSILRVSTFSGSWSLLPSHLVAFLVVGAPLQ